MMDENHKQQLRGRNWYVKHGGLMSVGFAGVVCWWVALGFALTASPGTISQNMLAGIGVCMFLQHFRMLVSWFARSGLAAPVGYIMCDAIWMFVLAHVERLNEKWMVGALAAISCAFFLSFALFLACIFVHRDYAAAAADCRPENPV